MRGRSDSISSWGIMNRMSDEVRISICCVCDQVRDNRQSNERPTLDGFEQWTSLRSFLQLNGLGPDKYKLSETYCPRCLDQLAKTGNGLCKL